MSCSLKSAFGSASLFDNGQGKVRLQIAASMIGSAVNLLAGREKIARGIVAGVLMEAGMPKLVVDGHKYDLNQILTVTPATFN